MQDKLTSAGGKESYVSSRCLSHFRFIDLQKQNSIYSLNHSQTYIYSLLISNHAPDGRQYKYIINCRIVLILPCTLPVQSVQIEKEVIVMERGPQKHLSYNSFISKQGVQRGCHSTIKEQHRQRYRTRILQHIWQVLRQGRSIAYLTGWARRDKKNSCPECVLEILDSIARSTRNLEKVIKTTIVCLQTGSISIGVQCSRSVKLYIGLLRKSKGKFFRNYISYKRLS